MSDAGVSTITPLGTVSAGVIAVVDEAGVVTVDGEAWSLDWWIGAEDRWHRPGEEPTVRQASVGNAPITETSLRVPGGDVRHRAYAVQATGPGWTGPAVVVEVENRSGVPVALAWVIQPGFERIEADGQVVRIDGRVGALLDRVPARAVQGTPGTIASRLAAGDDQPSIVPATVGAGGLEAALVVPLTHTATVRLLIPVLEADASGPKPRRPFRRKVAPIQPGPVWSAPDADAVERGWAAHTEGLAGLTVPNRGWDTAVEWSERVLSIAGPAEVSSALDPGRPAPTGPAASVRVAEVCEAMARSGSTDPLDPIALALARAQRINGVVRLGDGSDGSVALLHAAAAVLDGPAGASRVVDLIGPVAKAIRRLGRGSVPDELGHSASSALRKVASALVAIGQPEVGEDAMAAAARVSSAATPDRPAAAHGAGDVPQRSDGPLDRMLRLRRSVVARAFDSVAALDEQIAPRPTAAAGGGEPFDAAEIACRTNAILDVMVVETADGLDLLPGWTPTWYGQPLEVHAVRTSWGPVSFAIRWHDDRPALFCQVDRHVGRSGDAPPRIRITSLDPDWSAVGWSGDTLLPPVEGQAPAPAGVTVQVGAPIRRKPAD